MRYHLDLARQLSSARDCGVEEAARRLGRLKSEMAGAFYRDVNLDNVLDVYDRTLSEKGAAFDVPLSDPSGMDVFLEVHEGYLNAMWSDVWMSAEEEEGRTYPGTNISDVAPHAPEEAVSEAAFQIGYLEASSGASIDAIWKAATDSALAEGVEGHRNFNPEHFGNCMYFEMAGAGVSWEDDFPAVPGLNVPSAEFITEVEDIEALIIFVEKAEILAPDVPTPSRRMF
jgi:hypothetical protein